VASILAGILRHYCAGARRAILCTRDDVIANGAPTAPTRLTSPPGKHRLRINCCPCRNSDARTVRLPTRCPRAATP